MLADCLLQWQMDLKIQTADVAAVFFSRRCLLFDLTSEWIHLDDAEATMLAHRIETGAGIAKYTYVAIRIASHRLTLPLCKKCPNCG